MDEIHKEAASIEEFLLDPRAKEKRAEEKALDVICEQLFLSQKELEGIVEKRKRGEAARLILAKVAELTRELADKAKITYGEKRYLEVKH